MDSNQRTLNDEGDSQQRMSYMQHSQSHHMLRPPLGANSIYSQQQDLRDSNGELQPDKAKKTALQNRLYDHGMPRKKGLPSVKKNNPELKPRRTSGLQPRNGASSQTRLGTNHYILSKNRSALISGAAKAVQDPIKRKELEQETQLLQLSHRGNKGLIFASIDDVQVQANEPLFEEESDDTEPGTSRPNLIGRTQDPTSMADRAHHDIFTSLQDNKNMQSQMLHGVSEADELGNARYMLAAKSMSSFIPANQLLLKVPKVPTDGTIRPNHPVNNWVDNVKNQLTDFKQQKSKTFLPHMSHQQIKGQDHKGNDLLAQPQFTTFNCQPYHREHKTDFGVSKVKFNLPPSKSMSAFGKAKTSVAVTSVTGEQMMTPLGPASHLYKMRINNAHESGSKVGDGQMPYSQSEAFLQGRKNTKKLRLKIMQDKAMAEAEMAAQSQKQDSSSALPEIGGRQSFADKLRQRAGETRNPSLRRLSELEQQNQHADSKITPGQLETTEEVLRKHYFMAKATKKSKHQTLDNIQSPQKHILKKSQGERIEPMVLNKIRGDKIDKMQHKAASLMRLNAAWGLESKGPQEDRHKATVQADVEDGGVFTNVLDGQQHLPLEQISEMTDLDQMIRFYLEQPEDTGFFVYLIQGSAGDPYDLRPLIDFSKDKKSKQTQDCLVKYAENNARLKNLYTEKYYTMSKKGFTTFVQDQPVEFISLQDWYNDRQYYRQISNKNFFRNFQKWKIVRMWRRKITHAKRREKKEQLDDKLFIVDEVFGKILMKHRVECIDLSKKEIVDVTSILQQSMKLEEFKQVQQDKRDAVTKEIFKKSAECRAAFEAGISQTLDNLRQKETDPEEENSKNDFKSETQQPKQIVNTNPTLEALGFKHSLKYGPRSNLRKACSRFLRFSYLLDFLSTDALTNIYLNSARNIIDKLAIHTDIDVDAYTLDSVRGSEYLQMRSGQYNKQRSIKMGGTQETNNNSLSRKLTMSRPKNSLNPLFQIQIITKLDSQVPPEYEQIELIERYEPQFGVEPDYAAFNPMVHLELQESEDEDALEEQGYQGGPEEEYIDHTINKVEAKKINNLCKVWLEPNPDGKRFADQINECLKMGLACLKNYKRWSRSKDLDKYEAVLEEWDDRVCLDWEPPDSEHLDCDKWLEQSDFYKQHNTIVNDIIQNAFQKVDEYLETFNDSLQAYWENENTNFELLKDERLKNAVDVIDALFHRLKKQKNKFKDITGFDVRESVGMIEVQTDAITKELKAKPEEQWRNLQAIFPELIKDRIREVQKWLSKKTHSIKDSPSDVKAFVLQIQNMEEIDQHFQSKKDIIELNSQIYQKCKNAEIIYSNDPSVKNLISEAERLQNELSKALNNAREQADKQREVMKRQIREMEPQLILQAQDFLIDIHDQKFLNEETPIEVVLEDMDRLKIRIDMLNGEMQNMQKYQETLDLPINPFEMVQDAVKSFQIRHLLWNSLRDWTDLVEKWNDIDFCDINIEEIAMKADEFYKNVLKCKNRLPGSTATEHLSKLVGNFKSAMPIVQALGNDKLEDYHWVQIKEALDIQDPNFPLEEKTFTLGALIKFDLSEGEKQENVVHISTTAKQEYELRQKLNQIQDFWSQYKFVVSTYKETSHFIIENFSKVLEDLDEYLTLISDIQSSRYVKRLSPEVDAEMDSLNTMYEVVEKWRACQRDWKSLEQIFSSTSDLKKEISSYSEFSKVEKKLQKQYQKAKKATIKTFCNGQKRQDEKNDNDQKAKQDKAYDDNQKAMNQLFQEEKNGEGLGKRIDRVAHNQELAAAEGQPESMQKEKKENQVLKELNFCHDKMEEVQKEVEGYLDKKRTNFPRLYFISNDELLQLLSVNDKIEMIQPQLNKLFDQVSELKMAGPDHSNEIQGVLSADKEILQFTPSLKVTLSQGIPQCLQQIKSQIGDTVKKRIREASQQLRDVEPGKEWFLKHSGQAVTVATMVYWTQRVEEAIMDMGEEFLALNGLREQTEEQLQKLVAIIRGTDLNPIERKSLTALITLYVHNKDIIEELDDLKLDQTEDFQWKKCLRYYYEDQSGNQGQEIVVKQVNSSIRYANEYMGVTSRLVITPLTDRCWLTITGALHINLGASPKGPAGTGKTESTKDLAKGLGIFCMVFNCSDQIEHRVMTRIFSGVVQAGVWTCLDEFNRINVEVMSVIAQQLTIVREAKMAGMQSIILAENPIDFNPECGVFITMNPGYQGRAELPDNLKVLFRSVSMMIPAYGLVAQVMLFSEGFSKAESLAKKMVQLYKLSSEQLSQMDHYDFGMRAVKSVLVMAGNLKRANPDLPEDMVLIMAMRDANIPKFAENDIELFEALIKDLFPGFEEIEEKESALHDQIKVSLRMHNYEEKKQFVTKVEQLFETIFVRFGVMIVGPTGGGKTVAYQMLADAMTTLRQNNHPDQRYQETHYKCLNPKSISMDELYGVENPDDGSWTDGLASSIIRDMAMITNDNSLYWTVFDGPVDAIWIENMNTVLDDNCMLCLSNGERIKLRSQMRMLFEVQDLAAASPATVSRCGMVYMTPEELSWEPYKDKWIREFIQQKTVGEPFKSDDEQEDSDGHHDSKCLLHKEVIKTLRQSFDIVEEAFKSLELIEHCQAIPCNRLQVIQNLCSFLECLILRHLNALKYDKNNRWLRPLKAIFAFSFYWAFGGHYRGTGMRSLDNTMRGYFGNLSINGADTVYEYMIDPEDQFKFVHYKDYAGKRMLWQQFEYPQQPTPFFQLVVPTTDTKKITYVVDMLTSVKKPVFVTGATGTGKSMIVQQFIAKDRSKEMNASMPIELNFSAQTDSLSTQANITGKLDKRGGDRLGAQGNAKCLIFIDDVNMPQKEKYGAQPPIELLRQLIDKGGFYDRTTLQWKQLLNFTVVCAAAPPSGGREPLTDRFMRHFQVLNVPDATEETLTHIFDEILTGFFKSKITSEKLKASLAVQATIEIYTQVCRTMLPIPAKFHYTFNLRDVAKVFQGILMCEPKLLVSGNDNEYYAKLWLHECTRVFGDRLCTPEDIEQFQQFAGDILTTKFKIKFKPEELFASGMQTIFSNILNLDNDDAQAYEQIKSQKLLKSCLVEKLEQYNLTASSKLDLVFFDDAITHVCAIIRILNQPRGNAMLIGVSGTGKRSLTSLAASIMEHVSFQIKLSKNFDSAKFREQIKEKMKISGCFARPTTFILNDTQIMYESFLEDINNILNTGDITGLYDSADYGEISEAIDPILQKKKIPVNKVNIMQYYIDSLRDNFHIMLCMSPVGEKLRVRTRMFPSLINCCTLDWFNSWPRDALVSVSKQFLERPENNLSDLSQKALSELFPVVHTTVEAAVLKFQMELRRQTYVTPKSFLDTINLYLQNLQEVQMHHDGQVNRLKTGITNLKKTKEQIEVLQVQLKDLKPKLAEKQEQAEAKEKVIIQEQMDAQVQEQEALTEAANVDIEAKGIQLIKEDAENELRQAQPALEQAESTVNKLSDKDIQELRTVQKPTPQVMLALKVVMIYFGHKKPEWKDAQKDMNTIGFINRVKQYKKDNIDPKIYDAVGKIVNDKSIWSMKRIEESNKAAGGLAKWCYYVWQYSKALKNVIPKQERVRQMNAQYEESKARVDAKQAEVAQIKEEIRRKEVELNETKKQIEELIEDKNSCERRLQNAEKLQYLLEDEGKRWEQSLSEMLNLEKFFKGNVFLAAASLSYLGPFTGKYRDELLKVWQNECLARKLEISPNYSLVGTLGDPILLRDWQMNDLPSDSVSLDNAILTQKSTRWPLLIDPQLQAKKWLRKMLQARDFAAVTKGPQKIQGQSNFVGTQHLVMNAKADDDDGKEEAEQGSKKKVTSVRELELAICNGKTVLYEDAGEELDPGLDPILTKSVYEQDGIKKVNFGTKSDGIEYDDNFRFLITTKLDNPHFLPETCIKMAIINFSVTFDGLEEQLLVDVMRSQEPETQQKKDELTITIATSKNELYNLQSEILENLAQADTSSILDNEILIEKLEVSKSRSQTVKQNITDSVKVDEVINQTRDFYRPVAERGSILYFCIIEMSFINQMYQNSLQYVKDLFNQAIDSVRKVKSSDNLEVQMKLLQGLIDNITRELYEKICIGLFEEHKVVYAFIIATSIMRKDGSINADFWNFLLRGAGIFDKTIMPAKPEKFNMITSQAWELIYQLSSYVQKAGPLGQDGAAGEAKGAGENRGHDSNQPEESKQQKKKRNPFMGLINMILDNQDAFLQYINEESDSDFFYSMPCELDSKLAPFEKILLVKCLKPEKTLFAVQKYLEEEIGTEYSISPVSSMQNLFKASRAKSPVIFVLSQGVDPFQQVKDYADRNKIGEGFKAMSLGSGQEKIATKVIKDGQIEGHWVFLQNCHLFKSWMPKLEVLVSQMIENPDLNDNFRLILTSMPVDYFPQSILQSGLKMTTEPPRGIKANLQRSYQNIITSKTYDSLTLDNQTSRSINEGVSDAGGDFDGTHKGSAALKSPSPTASANMSHIPRNLNDADNRSSATPNIELYEHQEKKKAWRNLLFGMAFFHAVVQERRKFGPLGWNIKYEFSDSDLSASITMLLNFLNEEGEIPWDALKFMTGEINYGGNVTDEFDRRLMLHILNVFQNDDIVSQTNYKFSRSGTYQILEHEKIEQLQAHIDKMPNQDEPEIFGMHSNANIAYLRSESAKLIDTVLNVQPRASTSQEGESPEKVILNLIERLQGEVPESISQEMAKEIMKPVSGKLLHCFTTVLQQEVDRYNKLLQEIKSSLQNLNDAVLGRINMSAILDEMHTDLLKNRVPTNWKGVSYPSLKPLASWIVDLCERVSFMRKWATNGHPPAFWLAGFFFPHGFITGVLQTYARKHSRPIDLLSFEFQVQDMVDAALVRKAPADGVYIFGLFIENARWSMTDRCLEEAAPGEMFAPMPLIHFMPKYTAPVVKDDGQGIKSKGYDEDEEYVEVYKCPVYKTGARAGVLSTTGQSTNFILTVDLPCGIPETSENKMKRELEVIESTSDPGIIAPMSQEFWTLRGAAMLTMLSQ